MLSRLRCVCDEATRSCDEPSFNNGGSRGGVLDKRTPADFIMMRSDTIFSRRQARVQTLTTQDRTQRNSGCTRHCEKPMRFLEIQHLRLKSFWIAQFLGWGVYAAGIFLGILPRLVYADATDAWLRLVYESVFIASLFGASCVLRAVCRSSFRREATWLSGMACALLAACTLAIPCAVGAEWAFLSARGTPFDAFLLLARAWGAAIYAAILLVSWSGLYLGIKHYQLFEAQRERAQRAESLARRAQLEALRLQLHPHFLFNTLNAISTLIVEGDAGAANRMVVQLAGFLRVALNESGASEISLAREIANTRDYLSIEQARLGERLEVDISIAADAERALVPALLLQPIVENAVRHGITPRPAGGVVAIRAERAGPRIRIRVSDNGAGRPALSGGTTRRGLGLRNTMERLGVLYGSDHQLAVRWPDNGGCVVELNLPYSSTEAQEGVPVCAS